MITQFKQILKEVQKLDLEKQISIINKFKLMMHEIGHWIDAGIFVYAGSPTSVLTVVGGSGSLAAMSDTRKLVHLKLSQLIVFCG